MFPFINRLADALRGRRPGEAEPAGAEEPARPLPPPARARKRRPVPVAARTNIPTWNNEAERSQA